jgi:UPF0271 protein
MTLRIDLNSDLGESFGVWRMGADEALMSLVTSANIACGFHAGDPDTMRSAVALAVKHRVAVGAHPGLHDLAGFGRREMKLTKSEVKNLFLYQMGALDAFARAAGTRLTHVKPHGALYNMAARDFDLSRAIAEAIGEFDDRLALVGFANSELILAAEGFGLRAVSEVFADRNYEPDGTLTPRSLPNALLHDASQAASRVLCMVREGKVTTTDGREISIKAETVCVHSDTSNSVEFARAVRRILQENGVQILPMTAA